MHFPSFLSSVMFGTLSLRLCPYVVYEVPFRGDLANLLVGMGVITIFDKTITFSGDRLIDKPIVLFRYR